MDKYDFQGLTFEKVEDENYYNFTTTYFETLLVGHNQSGSFKVMNDYVFNGNEGLRDYVEFLINKEFKKLNNDNVEAV